MTHTRPLNIVHTVASLDVNAGGPSRTVPFLCHAINKHGIADVQIVTRFSQQMSVESQKVPVITYSASVGRANLYHTLSQLHAKRPIDIVHDHGQWLYANRMASSFCNRNGIARVVSTRGMQSPWARQHRWLKKQVAWKIYAKRDLSSAQLVHATSKLEKQELLNLGVKTPIAIIPNGVELYEFADAKKPPEGERTLLFLSRIHRKKGVRELLIAWKNLQAKGWRLDIVGPDEDNHLAELSNEISALGNRVRIVGPLDGAEKVSAYRNASLFVLPTFSENFGVVVAEALAAETPVITTTEAPWEMLPKVGCGWIIPPTIEALEKTLRQAICTDTHTLLSMGRRGREFVSKEYGWEAIGKAMLASYRTLC